MAVDFFFQNPSYYSLVENNVDLKKIDMFFARYANGKIFKYLIKYFYLIDPLDKEPNKIGPNGMQRLLNDLGVDPVDRLVLILAWKLKASTQCEFTLNEFRDGMKEMKYKFITLLIKKIKK